MFNKKLIFLFNIIFTVSLYAQNISIKRFDSEKLLHDFGEQVLLKGSVVNAGDEEIKADAEVWLKSGVEPSFLVAKKTVVIPAQSEKNIDFSWNPGVKEYGFAAKLLIKKENGDIIEKSNTAVFEVCHDWKKVIRQVSMPSYHSPFDPDHPTGKSENIDKLISHLRKFHLNVFEFGGEWSPTLDNLTPEEDIWPFWEHKNPNTSHTRRTSVISKDKVKEWIDKLHAAGIRVIGYHHTPTYTIPDESWRVYNPSTGHYQHYDRPPPQPVA
jgi:hypothetical protein